MMANKVACHSVSVQSDVMAIQYIHMKHEPEIGDSFPHGAVGAWFRFIIPISGQCVIGIVSETHLLTGTIAAAGKVTLLK